MAPHPCTERTSWTRPDASPLFPRHEIPLYGRSRFEADPGLTAALIAAGRRALDDPETLCDAGDRYDRTYFDDDWVASAGLDLGPARAVLDEVLATGHWTG